MASAIAYRHLPDAANARVAGENAGVLLASFQGALLESHALVGDLRVADQSLLSLIVVESMTNVLNVHASLQEQVENWQRMCAARASGGDGDLESGQRGAGPVCFNCDVCGEAALTVSIVIGQDGKGTLRKNSATYYSLDDKSAQAWLEALTDNPRSVLAGLAGEDMFCRECQKFYCREHWTNVRDYFDDGFYDYTAGHCPAGHPCIIDD